MFYSGKEGSPRPKRSILEVRAMPVACVVVPHFALRVAVLDQARLDGVPLVLGPPPGGRPLVADVSPEAAARGLRPGLGLREVAALCPAAVVLPPHPVREAAVADAVAAGLAALSPRVESDPAHPGCWYVDLGGSDRLLGSPAVAASTLLAAVPAPLRPRCGVAPSKFAARVAAGAAPPGGGHVVAAEAVADFLAGQPVAMLPVPPATLRQFERLGLRTLGDLATLPPAAVAARFGASGRHLWQLANGRDDDPVRPLPPPQTVAETLEMPAPATSRETLLVALTRLAARAFDRPLLSDKHVRQARLRALLEGGGSWEQLATLREPGGRRRVVAALGDKLAGHALPGPIERLTLELIGPVPIGGRQDPLPGLRARRPRELVEAVRALEQRFGASGLYTVVEVEPWSRLPERRWALIACDR